MVPTIRKIIRAGIPVMGHIGLTPQSVYKFGGFRLQGKTPEDAQRILDAARSLEDAGVFALILEKIPKDLARRVTESLSIPTIGIGAGPDCDGQVLIQQDMLGIFEKFRPRFVKHYAEIGQTMRDAFKQYIEEVRDGTFPADEHSYE
jgi:3-methyl-2-oxobutanoate hydroxymethyltransferase